ncbi:MAG: DUF1304 domain-containing protein [Flavobacteriaceae bacterium]|nr:DUF1304 domain-containing protein [Flavobacteriaceae bacterium]
MNLLLTLLIAFVALEHLYFLILEMFFWTKPIGLKTFGLKSKEYAEQSKVLAANQGLYNGFLAAGLIWSIIEKNTEIAIFFLSCVAVAGIYGAYSTKNIRLFYVQSVPALIGILLLYISY